MIHLRIFQLLVSSAIKSTESTRKQKRLFRLGARCRFLHILPMGRSNSLTIYKGATNLKEARITIESGAVIRFNSFGPDKASNP